jgi:hypothetical protein
MCLASNYTDWPPVDDYRVDVVAPGGRFIPAAAQAPDAYYTVTGCEPYWGNTGFGGTSAAAPVVTGIAAYLLSYDASLVGDDLAQVIRRKARDVDPPGPDQATGYGLARLDSSLRYISRPQLVQHGRIDRSPGAQGQLRVVASDIVVREFDNFPLLHGGARWAVQCTRYTLRGTGTWRWPFANAPDAWVRASGTAGWADAALIDDDEVVFGGRVVPDSLFSDRAVFETYVYRMPAWTGYDWLPVDTLQAAVAYTVVGRTAPSVAVEENASAALFRLALSPVPSTQLPTVRFRAPTGGPVVVSVLDVTGRTRCRHTSWARAGQEFALDLQAESGGGGLSPGLYWIRVSVGGLVTSRRAIVLAR